MVQRTLPVVHTAGLCKTFRDFWRRPRVEAVKNLDLEIRPGEVFGLLGPNGSGKTTTIKLLLGLLYATKGRISVFGKAPTDVSVKAKIGFLPEESYLYRYLDAHETLDYYGRLFRLPGRIRRDRTQRLLDMVGLRHEANRPVGEYSKGMARRIGLAQALINDPEFLILDEPTSGLDPIGARQIKDVIRDLGKKGKTILLSSHILADVEDVCDRVVILYGGQEMAAGNINDLLAQRDRTQLTTSVLSDETVEKIRVLIAKEEKKELLEVIHPRQRLETFFLRTVQEAQARNIHTSGARAAGEVPDFLKRATEATTADVVGPLVDAGSHTAEPLPVSGGEPPTVLREDEPAGTVPPGELMEQLLGRGIEEPASTDTAATKTTLQEPPGEPRPTQADDSVIDALMQVTDEPPDDVAEERT